MKIVVLTGAGISAESGLKTFRDANGLWEGHDVMQVASPQGWQKDEKLVLEFYNQRRRQLKEVQPNAAHKALADLQEHYEVKVITQNVDDLHERAGSGDVIHLHGELLKVRCTQIAEHVVRWEDDLNKGDLSPFGHQLRPHIVWFGEEVPMMEKALFEIHDADAVMIVGTSMQVYPAAGLMQYAPSESPVLFIDPKPALSSSSRVTVFAEPATIGVGKAIEKLKSL